MSDRDIIEFFDSWALVWDERMVIDEDIVKTILDRAKVCAGKRILDVACGTGVLIPYYLKRDVLDVTGIDISPKMIEIAQNKFQMEKVKFICDNAVDHEYDEKYDCIVIYNAFPHFEDPERLIGKMSLLLKEGGTLSVAHGMSRERINAHHDNVTNVSRLLPDVRELQKVFEKHLKVSDTISDERMYLITGVKE